MFWFNFNTIHLKYFDFDVRDVRIRIDTQSLFWYVNFLILILSCHIFTAVFFLNRSYKRMVSIFVFYHANKRPEFKMKSSIHLRYFYQLNYEYFQFNWKEWNKISASHFATWQPIQTICIPFKQCTKWYSIKKYQSKWFRIIKIISQPKYTISNVGPAMKAEKWSTDRKNMHNFIGSCR